MTPIIRDALAEARRRLAGAAFEPALREANLLLARSLGWSESQLLSRIDQRLKDQELERFEVMLSRRLTGEPIAYILGEKEFYGRPFAVDRRVLIPRPETEHLVEAALELTLPSRPSILDLGTGSGCVACTLALELPTSRLLAADLSLASLAVARQNSLRYRLGGRLRLVAADLANGLVLSHIDLVVSNPPYIGSEEAHELSPEILEFEPAAALFAGLRGDIVHRRLLAELAGLRSAAWLLVEIGAHQEAVIRRLSAASAFELMEIRPDYAGHPRIARLRRR